MPCAAVTGGPLSKEGAAGRSGAGARRLETEPIPNGHQRVRGRAASRGWAGDPRVRFSRSLAVITP